MTPIVDGIKGKYGKRLRVERASMDKSDGKALARKHGVVGTPAILLLDNEGTRVNLLRGMLPRSLIEKAVEDLIAQ